MLKQRRMTPALICYHCGLALSSAEPDTAACERCGSRQFRYSNFLPAGGLSFCAEQLTIGGSSVMISLDSTIRTRQSARAKWQSFEPLFNVSIHFNNDGSTTPEPYGFPRPSLLSIDEFLPYLRLSLARMERDEAGAVQPTSAAGSLVACSLCDWNTTRPTQRGAKQALRWHVKKSHAS